MKDRYKFPIMLLFFILMVYQINKWSKASNDADFLLLKNDFVLNGVVDSLQVSDNHCFAVIYLQKFRSNFKCFNPKKNKKYFPYAIKNGNAEIYVNVCEGQIDNGDSIIVDSNRSIVFFKTKSNGNFKGNLKFAQGDISFIRRKTRLFPQNFSE